MGTLVGSTFRDALCAEFNGSNEYVYIDDPSFVGDTAGSFVGWVRLATLLGANGNKGILGMGMNSGADNSFVSLRQARSAATSNQNRIQVIERMPNAGTLNTPYGNTSLAATTWYHVALLSDGSTYTVRLNDTLQTLTGTNNVNWFGDLPTGSKRFTVGCNWAINAVNTYNDCRMNEWLYVGGRALSSAEVTEHYNAGVPKNPHRLSFRADIDSWWRFGDSRDSATTIFDEIGSNNLTLVNMDASNYVAP